MASPYQLLTPLTELLSPESWPSGLSFAGETAADVLQDVYVADYELYSTDRGVSFALTLVMLRELAVDLPGLGGTQLVFGGSFAEGTTSARLAVSVHKDGFEVGIEDVALSLRFPRHLLSPVEDAATATHAEIALTGAVRIDENFDVRFESDDSISLPPVMIGNSSITIAADDVELDLSRTTTPQHILDAGFDESFVGVYIATARIGLPPGLPRLAPEDLIVTDAAVGTGGVSATLAVDYGMPEFVAADRSFRGRGAGDLFGTPMGVERISLEVRENALLSAQLRGRVLLPYFDKLIEVVLDLDLDGNISLTLAGGVDEGDHLDEANGLLTLHKDGVADLVVEALGIDIHDGDMTFVLSGTLTPDLLGVDWPGLEVRRLAIDTSGNVAIDGGWMELPKQYAVELHGFQLELSRLGFGNTDDGGRWLGVSGALKLADGLPAATSVDGLRVAWYPDGHTEVTFEGIGVMLEVADVLKLEGKVRYESETQGFRGAVSLDIAPLSLSVDGSLVVQKQDDVSSFAVYLATELPAGVPLWATGLSLYGVAGLFALNMEPDRRPDQPWFSADGGSWFHAGTPGVADLGKWRTSRGSLGLGAGITIGTTTDNGHAFSAKALLAIVFPGPLLLIEGSAGFLRERAKLAAEEPPFRAVAVLDNRERTFLLGIDAAYSYDDAGRLVRDLQGSAEAFFSFDDARRWYVHLGERQPPDKRLRAELFQLFEARGYLALEPDQLALGARLALAEDWTFGPLRLELEAWLESNAALSWRPSHLHGDLSLGGRARLEAYGVGASVGVTALIAADAFDPFHLLAELRVKLGLPWPIPDIKKDVSLEWGPSATIPLQQIPLPLEEASVEHFKTTVAWPLTRGDMLLPVYDSEGRGFLDGPAGPTSPPDLDDAPVVPLDARPRLTFRRSIHDDARVGINPQPVDPATELIGDPLVGAGPARVRLGLREVALQRCSDGSWVDVARKGTDPNPPGVSTLFGSWAPTPQLGTGEPAEGTDASIANVKLWLWSKTPFDASLHTGGSWDEWFASEHGNYPCLPLPADQESCCDPPAGVTLQAPWVCPDTDIRLLWDAPEHLTVQALDNPFAGFSQAVCLPSAVQREHRRNHLVIELGRPAKIVRVHVRDKAGVSAVAYDSDGVELASFSGGTPEAPLVELEAPQIARVVLGSNTTACVARICVVRGPTAEEAAERVELEGHIREQIARWSDDGFVLRPFSSYRLRIGTTADVQGLAGPLSGHTESHTIEEFAYFRTAGPPSVSELSLPAFADGEFQSPLVDLSRYVRFTIPPTVAVPSGEARVSRPVFRSYDVGVEFNEDYVDLMYRLARRDLAVYLFDNNGSPARDVGGRLLVLENLWGRTEQRVLRESERRWLETVEGGECVTIELPQVTRQQTLGTTGLTLNSDTLYRARLVPLLFADDFRDYPAESAVTGPTGQLGPWEVVDQGAVGGISRWEVRHEEDPNLVYVEQVSQIHGGSTRREDPRKLGTMLLAGDLNWTDYRLSVTVGSSDDDAIGLVFRYSGPQHYYRFSWDRQRRMRSLVRVVDGAHRVLAFDDVPYVSRRDYRISIEAIGDGLRVFVDGENVLSVRDDGLPAGKIGLYCWANGGARFANVRLDELRRRASAAFEFEFTTSRYANFHHQLHSFQDSVWSAAIDEPAAAALSALRSRGGEPSARPNEDEGRAYEEAVAELLSAGASSPIAHLDISYVATPGQRIALLVRSSEPIDWGRTELEVARRPPGSDGGVVPGRCKIVDVAFPDRDDDIESVTLLAREPTQLAGHSIEVLRFPSAEPLQSDCRALFSDRFDGRTAGALHREDFGPNALDHYQIVDRGDQAGPSQWSSSDTEIVQVSGLFGGSIAPNAIDAPGTVALTGDATYGDYIVRVGLRSEGSGAIGFVFRWQDADNHYRFSTEHVGGYRRLVRRSGGVPAVLWEDGQPVPPGSATAVEIWAYGDELVGWVDNQLLFVVRDTQVATGRVGFYCSSNAGAHFDRLEVDSLHAPRVRWAPDLAEDVDFEARELGPVGEPATWSLSEGALMMIDSPTLRPTVAVSAFDLGEDSSLTMRLRVSAVAEDGLVVGLRPNGDHYRFTSTGDRWQFVRSLAGTETNIWQTPAPLELDRDYDLTVRMGANSVAGFVDGSQVLTLRGVSVGEGRAGAFHSGGGQLVVSRILAADESRHIDVWRVVDEGVHSNPSEWRAGRGELVQTSNIYGGDSPEMLGTYVVAGEEWEDYCVKVRLRSDDNDGIGVMFRYSDPNNYYRFSMDAQRNYRRLVRKHDGDVTVLWESGAGFVLGASGELRLEMVGQRITGWFEQGRLFEVQDGWLPRGRIGLYAWGNTGARFSHVEVTPVPASSHALYRDRFSDGDIGEWNIVDEGTLGAPSVWVATDGRLRQTSNIYAPPTDRDELDKLGSMAIVGSVGWSDVLVRATLASQDDDALGVVFRYQDASNYYRFSMDAQRGYRRLTRRVAGITSLLWEDGFAYEAGISYEVAVLMVGGHITLFWDGVPVARARDENLGVGRIGLYSWGSAGAEFSDVSVFPAPKSATLAPFAKLFAFADRWQVRDEATAGAPSVWEATEEDLVQSSPIGDDVDASDVIVKRGTTVSAQVSWRDYRASIRVGGERSGSVGVLVRQAEADTYYELRLDHDRGVLLFLRRLHGEYTLLWEEAMPTFVTNSAMVSVACVGSRLSGWLNGVQLFTLIDSSIAQGGIGLFSWKNSDARFSVVEVCQATWRCLHLFSSSDPSAAGARVVVHSGSEDAAPTFHQPATAVAMGANAKGTRSRLKSPARVRLRDQHGNVLHEREFRDSEDDAMVPVTLLRKRDGTEFLALPDEGSFQHGEHMLRFRFRRDNRAKQPDAPVLREHGHSDAELVALRIPASVADEPNDA